MYFTYWHVHINKCVSDIYVCRVFHVLCFISFGSFSFIRSNMIFHSLYISMHIICVTFWAHVIHIFTTFRCIFAIRRRDTKILYTILFSLFFFCFNFLLHLFNYYLLLGLLSRWVSVVDDKIYQYVDICYDEENLTTFLHKLNGACAFCSQQVIMITMERAKKKVE